MTTETIKNGSSELLDFLKKEQMDSIGESLIHRRAFPKKIKNSKGHKFLTPNVTACYWAFTMTDEKLKDLGITPDQILMINTIFKEYIAKTRV